MFAYMRHLDDPKNKYIVPTCTIKDFNALNYDKREKYYVWWEPPTPGKNSQAAGYYAAQVLQCDDSREKLEKILNIKRIPTPKLKTGLEEEVQQADCNDNKNQLRKQKERMKFKQCKIEATKKKTLQAMLKKSLQRKRMQPITKKLISTVYKPDEDKICDPGPEFCFDELPCDHCKNLSQENASLVNERKELKEENVKLWGLNEKLQIVLTSKVLQADYTAVTYEPNEKGELMEIKYAAAQTPLQNTCPIETDPVGNISNLTTEGDNESSEDMNNYSTLSSNESNACADNSLEWIPHFMPNGQVYLGSGVFLSKERWTNLQHSRTYSIYVKELGLAIWTPEVLKQRSVTGMPCNKNKNKNFTSAQKPCLTPQKREVVINAFSHHLKAKGLPKEELATQLKKINKYLNGKIQDLNKPPRSKTGQHNL